MDQAAFSENAVQTARPVSSDESTASPLRQTRRQALPYLILTVVTLPSLVGYAWIMIASFSQLTHGLLPLDAQGNLGGFTFENWRFLSQPEVWRATLNSFGIGTCMVVGVGTISCLSAYALSRMGFPGRRGFLGTTVVLYAFRPEMLLIAIFQVLLFIGGLPLIGKLLGFNTVGGVVLVMVTLDLPLGIWLMKGFFDDLPWDIERAALIDGAGRLRVWREILLPQLSPGLGALSVYMFVQGWNAYLIPYTYTIGSRISSLPAYINSMAGASSPDSWNKVAAVGLFQLIPVFIFIVFTRKALLRVYGGGSKGR